MDAYLKTSQVSVLGRQVRRGVAVKITDVDVVGDVIILAHLRQEQPQTTILKQIIIVNINFAVWTIQQKQSIIKFIVKYSNSVFKPRS